MHVPHRSVLKHLSWIALPLLLAACEAAPHSDSQRLANDQTPPPVVSAFQKTYPGMQIDHVDYFQNYHGRGPGYEIKFYDAAGVYHRKGFSPSGALLDDPTNVAVPGAQQPYPGQPTYAPPPGQPYPQPYAPQPAPPPPPRY